MTALLLAQDGETVVVVTMKQSQLFCHATAPGFGVVFPEDSESKKLAHSVFWTGRYSVRPYEASSVTYRQVPAGPCEAFAASRR